MRLGCMAVATLLALSVSEPPPEGEKLGRGSRTTPAEVIQRGPGASATADYVLRGGVASDARRIVSPEAVRYVF